MKISYRSRNNNVLRKPSNRRNHIIRRNLKITLENKNYRRNWKKITVKYSKTIE